MTGVLSYFETSFNSEHLGSEAGKKRRGSSEKRVIPAFLLEKPPAHLERLAACDSSDWLSCTATSVEIPASKETIALAVRAIHNLPRSHHIDLDNSEDFHLAARGVAAVAAELGETEALYREFDATCATFAGYDRRDNRRKFDRYHKAAQNGSQHITASWLFSSTGLLDELVRLVNDEPPNNESDAAARTDAAVSSNLLTAQQLPPLGELVVKPRPSVWGPYLMRRAITLLGGSGGTGKSVFSLALALSMAIGRDLLSLNSREAELQPRRVVVLNNEDDEDELTRRLAAILDHYAVTPTEYALAQKNLFFRSGTSIPVKLAIKLQGDQRSLFKSKWVEKLLRFCEENEIDAVFADPLVSLHDAQENDNVEMDAVMQIAKELAAEGDLAILLIHHSRKGGSGNVDEAFRGASAVVNAARAVILLSRMTEKEARTLDLCGSERTRFFRMDFGKQNYGLPPDEASWFRNQSVTLHTCSQSNSKAETTSAPLRVSVGVPEPVVLAPVETEGPTRTTANDFLRALHDSTWPIRIKDQYPQLRQVCGVKDDRTVRRHVQDAFPVINAEDKSDATLAIYDGSQYRMWLEKPSNARGLSLHRQKQSSQS